MSCRPSGGVTRDRWWQHALRKERELDAESRAAAESWKESWQSLHEAVVARPAIPKLELPKVREESYPSSRSLSSAVYRSSNRSYGALALGGYQQLLGNKDFVQGDYAKSARTKPLPDDTLLPGERTPRPLQGGPSRYVKR